LQAEENLNANIELTGVHILNRNILYVAIGLLAVAAGVLGYFYYQENKKATGVEINIDDQGISIQKQ